MRRKIRIPPRIGKIIVLTSLLGGPRNAKLLLNYTMRTPMKMSQKMALSKEVSPLSLRTTTSKISFARSQSDVAFSKVVRLDDDA
jgi:hypothetical protein